ncbi:hypothetical protein JCM19037_1278 [Geomicrobium sp. JCM 19037]|uniref:tripartite tricarboxylate transporter TctB family protein n=1 Tax=Geomicrobium sp. JCM 19037 TaxID=1460634 RepID=UPI00045F3A84|nr:tripartite tricarboxylate transporter TctB family protein [Geomicrobium sp. JCM 19037]GAK03001.1 hypothetical protein JCM19037_1278 [Geomicrobium sp. JCM 19037]
MATEIKNLLFLFAIGAFTVYYYLDVQALPEPEERILVEVISGGLFILLGIRGSWSIYKIIRLRNDETSFLQDILTWLKNKQAMLLLSFILYVIFIPILGFFTSTVLFFIGINYYLKSRKWWEMTILPVVVISLIYFIFVFFLQVNIPTGLLI